MPKFRRFESVSSYFVVFLIIIYIATIDFSIYRIFLITGDVSNFNLSFLYYFIPSAQITYDFLINCGAGNYIFVAPNLLSLNIIFIIAFNYLNLRLMGYFLNIYTTKKEGLSNLSYRLAFLSLTSFLIGGYMLFDYEMFKDTCPQSDFINMKATIYLAIITSILSYIFDTIYRIVRAI